MDKQDAKGIGIGNMYYVMILLIIGAILLSAVLSVSIGQVNYSV